MQVTVNQLIETI